MGELIRPVIFVCAALVGLGQSVLTRSVSTEKDATMPSTGKDDAKPSAEKGDGKPPVIVVGFVGGFVAHDNMVHSGVQLAAHLRSAHPSGVYVEVFENRHREKAHRETLKILNADHNGTLSGEEKKKAKIIINGIDWGAPGGVSLAKE